MEQGIQQRSFDDFPALLKEISDPPQRLYLRGTYPASESKFLCVVGSRKYTPYGKSVVKKLIEGLRGYPIVIVSGLALGIDSFAHQAALDADLKTVAVPGSGIADSVLYPRSHVPLAHRILKASGALLSEFEPTFKARPESFPQRNRIMAGLSHAALIIEAEMRSGTLITARLAMEYNRDVFAVPNAITTGTSAGPHYLIQNGAKLITSSADILEALAIEEKVADNSYDNLSEEEQRVLHILQEAKARDELIHVLSLPTHEANILLSAMELKGLITTELGKITRK